MFTKSKFDCKKNGVWMFWSRLQRESGTELKNGIRDRPPQTS